MACLLTLLPRPPQLRPRTLPFSRDCYHSSLAFANARFSNSAQNSSEILANSSIGCRWIKRKMGLLPTGVVLSFLLLGGFHNDVASAEAAALGLDFFAEQKQQIEPRKGTCATCLGVVDETLGACGRTPNCVSSFDDRPSFFMAPWEFPGKLPTAFEQINRILLAEGGDVVEQGNRLVAWCLVRQCGDVFKHLEEAASNDVCVCNVGIFTQSSQKRMARLMTWNSCSAFLQKMPP